MSWKKVGSTVAKYAPLLGGVIGGPAGAGVGSLIASVFGVENNPDEIMQAIKADPDAAVKLKGLELDNKVELEKLQIQSLNAVLSDKQNARQSNPESYMQEILSLILMIGIGGLVYLLFFIEIPEGSASVLFMLLGVVIKEWGNSMVYWFGAHRSSSEKSTK